MGVSSEKRVTKVVFLLLSLKYLRIVPQKKFYRKLKLPYIFCIHFLNKEGETCNLIDT